MNTRTAWLPLMVTFCPLPSMVVSAAIVISAVKVIVPLQLKVTVPPPANAASRCASSQTLTMPPACAGAAGDSVSSCQQNREQNEEGHEVFGAHVPISFD